MTSTTRPEFDENGKMANWRDYCDPAPLLRLMVARLPCDRWPPVTRAAVVDGGAQTIEILEITIDEIRDHDVLIRYMAAGVCHTDLSVVEGAVPLARPMILGHEGAGVVEAVGSSVQGVKVGDHVALTGIISCGTCATCQNGHRNLCEWGLPTIMSGLQPDGDFRSRDSTSRGLHQCACLGTFAEKAIVPEAAVIPIPSDVPFEVAALIGCGVLTGAGAIFNRARLRPGASVAVFGCGSVGLSAIQAARMLGATTVIAIDPRANKRAMATDLGATATVDPFASGGLDLVRNLTAGRGVDCAIECAGVPGAVRQAWDVAAVDGTVIATGVPPAGATVELPANQMWSTEKTLMCSVYGSGNPARDISTLVELYRQGSLAVDVLVTRRYVLDELGQALADLKDGLNARGVVVY